MDERGTIGDKDQQAATEIKRKIQTILEEITSTQSLELIYRYVDYQLRTNGKPGE